MQGVTFKVVIPARHGSTRLPGKPLLPIAGRPMLLHVYERAVESGAGEVVIATDDTRISEVARGFGAGVCMTDASHASGTERIAEVVDMLGWADDDIVVNLQGDEPLMPPALLRQAAVDLSRHAEVAVTTLASPLEDVHDLADPGIVKVVLDQAGYALYFSRAPIPFDRDGDTAGQVPLLRHVGLYGYRASFLKVYSRLAPSPLERAEKLEQLRILWHGMKIHVEIACASPGPGVDTPDDLARVAALLD